MELKDNTKVIFYTKKGKMLNYKFSKYPGCSRAFLGGYDNDWRMAHNCNEFVECDCNAESYMSKSKFVAGLGGKVLGGGVCPEMSIQDWERVLKGMLPYFKNISVDGEFLSDDEEDTNPIEGDPSVATECKFSPIIHRASRTKIFLD